MLRTDDIAGASKNTARIENECSIMLCEGNIVCYQPKNHPILLLFIKKLT